MADEHVTIVVPIPNKVLQPNCTIASFGGRMMKAAAIKKMRRVVAEKIEAEQIETAPWPRCAVAAKFFFGTNRRRDQDNAMGSLKSVYDGIVDSGLAVDDDYKHMERYTPAFLHDKEHPRVEITISRIP